MAEGGRRIAWSDRHVQTRVRRLLARGFPAAAIADRLGCSTAALKVGISRYDLSAAPPGWMRSGDAARALDLHPSTVMDRASKTPEVRRPWGGEWIVCESWVEAQQAGPPVLDRVPEGYRCASELASQWGYRGPSAVHRLLQPLPHTLVRQGRHIVRYYAPQEYAKVRPMTLPDRPPGLLTRVELAAALGLTRHQLDTLRKKGLPAYPWKSHRYQQGFYQPRQVRAWLAQHRPELTCKLESWG